MPKRIYASLVHLGISLLLVTCVLIVVMLVWYPHPYFEAMGVGKMLLILISVDVTIGPIITLIIFNPKKASLKFDLAVIAILQLAALAYGVSVVFEGRPVYVVFNIDRFTVVSANEIPLSEMAKMPGLALPITGPRIVGVRAPLDNKERERILFSSVQGGADLPQMPQYYLPYAQVSEDVKTKTLPLDLLINRQSKSKTAQVKSLIDSAVAKNGLQTSDVGFVPMHAKVQDLSVLIRRSDATILAVLKIDPWAE